MKKKNFLLFLAMVFLLCEAITAMAASKGPATVAELALYRGKDRQQILEEGAKKEGTLTFYTTGILTQTVRPLVDAFQKKYPFIKVEIWRASGREILPRLIDEYRVDRYVADAIEVNQMDQVVIEESGLGLLQPFYSPNLDQMEEGSYKKAPGGGAVWAAHYQSGIGLGYNTKLISRVHCQKITRNSPIPNGKAKELLLRVTRAFNGWEPFWMAMVRI